MSSLDPIPHHHHRRMRRLLLAAGACLLAACAGDTDGDAAGDASDDDVALASAVARSVPLDSGAVRQPVPAGIDPAMIEWRSDGVLIPSQDSLTRTPGYVVDSIFPPEEALRRFQADAGGTPVSQLAGGADSYDALLREYWRVLRTGDTLALSPLVVSKAEFAYLYFPESGEPASGMPPNVSWLLLSNNSGRGLVRALSQASTDSADVTGTVCSQTPKPAGQSRIHGPCGIVRQFAASRDTLWISTHIIERDGIFKLMSFTNEL